MNDLMQSLVDVWAGVKQSVVGDAIDQRRERLRACLLATGGHIEY